MIRIEGVPYGDYVVTVEAETLPEAHEQVAQIEELNQDAMWLRAEFGIEGIAATFRDAGNKGKHYGFAHRGSNLSLDFGQGERGLYPGWRNAYHNPKSESGRGKLYNPDNYIGASQQEGHVAPPEQGY